MESLGHFVYTVDGDLLEIARLLVHTSIPNNSSGFPLAKKKMFKIKLTLRKTTQV